MATLHERLNELERDPTALGAVVRNMIAAGSCPESRFSDLVIAATGRPISSELAAARKAGKGPAFELSGHPSSPTGYSRRYRPRTVLAWALMKGWTLDVAKRLRGGGYYADRYVSWEEKKGDVAMERHLRSQLDAASDAIAQERARCAALERELAVMRLRMRRRSLLPKEALLARAESPLRLGIYFLWKGSDLVYVGQTTSFHARLSAHLNSEKEFDRYTFLPVASHEELNELEALYIEAFEPPLNKARPAVRGAELESAEGAAN